jgi:hypothetical protein
MRRLVEPPPSSRCARCGGALLLKLVEAANPIREVCNEIFVCAACAHEQAYAVSQSMLRSH